jgi:hypothetical protein
VDRKPSHYASLPVTESSSQECENQQIILKEKEDKPNRRIQVEGDDHFFYFFDKKTPLILMMREIGSGGKRSVGSIPSEKVENFASRPQFATAGSDGSKYGKVVRLRVQEKGNPFSELEELDYKVQTKRDRSRAMKTYTSEIDQSVSNDNHQQSERHFAEENENLTIDNSQSGTISPKLYLNCRSGLQIWQGGR